MRRVVVGLLVGGMAVSVASCMSVGGTTPAPRQLTAQLHDARGNPVGTATLSEAANGTRLVVIASALPPGLHGIHVHTRGVCTAPDFSSAGLHFNPGGRHHGLHNPVGPHAGDFPDLEVGADGHAQYDIVNTALRLSGPEGVQPDSAAVVIHAQADDQLSDPSGNSGARIACGVLTTGGGRRRAP